MKKNTDKSIGNYLKGINHELIALLLAILMVLTVMIVNYNRAGSGDFYYHVSVVKELNNNLLSPKHPSFGSDDTTQYFTPYHVLVSLFSRATGLQALDAFFVMGLINVLLLLLAIYLFTKALYGYFTVYSMVFVLFLWGAVWGFSGEYSYRILGSTASYHSTFSLWLMLITYTLALKANKYNLILLPILAMMAILSQPISIFAVTFGVLLMLWKRIQGKRAFILCAAFFLIALGILMLLWPYYPLIQLSKAPIKTLGSWPRQTFPMYQPLIVLKCIWPALLAAFLFLVRRIKEHAYLLLLAAALFVVYLAFSWKNSELIARNMPLIMLFILIASAYGFESSIKKNARSLLFLIVLIPLVVYNLAMGGLKYFKQDTGPIAAMKHELPVVAKHIKPYDVVLTDINTGYYLVAYSGKVVSTVFWQKYVPDQSERQRDIETLYAEDTTNQQRLEIAHKYDAKYVLINKAKNRITRRERIVDANPAITDSLRALGTPVLELNQLQLIKLEGSNTKLTQLQ